MELKGKIAIVTGGGRGIGEGIALVLAREGANVVLTARKMDEIASVAKKIESQGGKAIPLIADVTKKADVQAMAASTVDAFGAIDILVNNAGTEAPARLTKDLPEEQWDQIMGINLKGVFLCCQAVIPQMMKQNKGRIINIGSNASIRMTFFGSLEYTVAKHGGAGLTQHLAWELADSHITVNTVCPGFTLTPLMEKGSSPEFRDAMIKRLVPSGRLVTIEEIGEAVSFLASDRAAMITGQMLAVDGGLLTGYGEDLRTIVRRRIEEMQAKTAHP